MFEYVAYKLGGTIPYPVTKIIWRDKEQLVFFDGQFYNIDECILCADTGLTIKGKRIYEGDILQLDIPDSSCYCKGKIGIVFFHRGQFCWEAVDGWRTYSLYGKNWKKLGNIACDVERIFTLEQRGNSLIRKVAEKKKGAYYGVLLEKTLKQFKPTQGEEISDLEVQSKKAQKKLLFEYANYLKIKKLIEGNKIYPDIVEKNLTFVTDSE